MRCAVRCVGDLNPWRAPAAARASPEPAWGSADGDLLAALAGYNVRRLETDRAEDGGVEGERGVEVAADEIEMAEPDEHRGAIIPG